MLSTKNLPELGFLRDLGAAIIPLEGLIQALFQSLEMSFVYYDEMNSYGAKYCTEHSIPLALSERKAAVALRWKRAEAGADFLLICRLQKCL